MNKDLLPTWVCIPTKKTLKDILIDRDILERLEQDPFLKRIKFLDNLREHSSGCVVFQRRIKKKLVTIYLHRWIANLYKESADLFGIDEYTVSFYNKNRLDCRVENLKRILNRRLRQRRSQLRQMNGLLHMDPSADHSRLHLAWILESKLGRRRC